MSRRIRDSAGRHGISDYDIEHAYRNLIEVRRRDDGSFQAYGVDRAGNLREIAYRLIDDEIVVFRADRDRRRRPRKVRP